jgi:type I restriction enzyme S subunit
VNYNEIKKNLYQSFELKDLQYIEIGKYIKEVQAKNNSNKELTVLAVTKYNGLVDSLEYFKNRVYSKKLSNYKIIKKGQFAYSPIHLNEGSIGYLIKYDEALLSPLYKIFEIDSNNLDRYFLYNLLKTKKYITLYNKLCEGSINRRASVSFKKFSKIKIILLPIIEQRKITTILSTVDDLIENTSHFINSYALLKKGLMQTLLTKGIGHTKFKKTKIGEMPVDWEIKRFKEMTDILRCGVASTPKYVENGIPFLSAQNVQDEKLCLKKYNYISKEYHKQLTKIDKPRFGDILYTRVGNCGNAAIVDIDFEFSIYVSLTLIRMKKEHNSLFFKYYLNSQQVKKQAGIGQFRGGGVTNLNVKVVEKFFLAVPPIKEQEKIAAILSTVEERIELYNSKKVKLENLKKGLMQQLLTGKIRVKV